MFVPLSIDPQQEKSLTDEAVDSSIHHLPGLLDLQKAMQICMLRLGYLGGIWR
jgi:hypothetical protein